MENYKELYLELFNGITDIIEDLKVLQAKAEEHFLDNKESYTIIKKGGNI